MTDLILALAWLSVLLIGIAVTIALRKWGLASTHARDLLHIGAGIWVLGWPLWEGWVAPTLIAAAGAVGVALMPRAARHVPLAQRFVESVTGGDERYGGLVHYALAFAVLTPVGVIWQPFAAGVALLALAWGDGPGGAVGRRYGRHRYQLSSAKPKSIEGSAVVALGAAFAALVAARLLAPSATAVTAGIAALVIGLVAAAAEALSPRSADNAIVPAAVFVVAMLTPLIGSPT